MRKLTHRQLAKYFVDELEKGSSVKDIATRVTSVLIEKKQSKDSLKLIRLIEEELNKRGQGQLKIVSANELSDSLIDEISDLMGVKDPVVNLGIDKNLIGGFKARYGETNIDLSVAGQLDKFRRKVINKGN